MALLYKAKKAEFDSFDDSVKTLYKADGDDFILDVDGAETDTSGLKNKISELLDENKSFKQKLKDEQEAKAAEALKLATDSNNFEELYKSSQGFVEQARSELDALKLGISREKAAAKAVEIASELAEGKNVKLLTAFVSNRIKVIDDKLIVLDRDGQQTVATADDLKKEFIASGEYDSLLTGSKSGGGGAAPQNRGGAANKTMPRGDFDTLDNKGRSDFIKSGGTVTND
jgi:hypothetical protein